MKIWLDDTRVAPDGWHWCRSVNGAKELIVIYEILHKISNDGLDWNLECISLDHDLGCFNSDGGDGIALMDWLVERGTLYNVEFHTMNPVGRENMVRMYRRYWLKESL